MRSSPFSVSRGAMALLCAFAVIMTGCSAKSQPPAEPQAQKAAEVPSPSASLPADPVQSPGTETVFAANVESGSPRSEVMPASDTVQGLPWIPAAQVSGEGTPKADEILDALTKSWTSAEVLAFSVKTNVKGSNDGTPVEHNASYEVVAQRPNRFSVSMKGGVLSGPIALLCDGKSLSLFIEDQNAYVSGGAPEDFGALGEIMHKWTDDLLGVHLSLILDSEPREALSGFFSAVTYAGTQDVGGVACHDISFKKGQAKVSFLVTQSEVPVLRKIDLDLAPGASTAEASTRIIMDFSDWKTGDSVPQDKINFKAPAGATKRAERFSGSWERPLLGEAAPELNLELMSGGKLSLADHKGKDIVILDFWATWCPPCRMTMPILEKLAEERKGVVLRPINVGPEEPEKILNFMRDQGLSADVAIDASGQAGKNYKVNGLPHIAVIDKNGIVQAVYIGMPQDFETRVAKVLDTLLADKSLVAP